MARWYQNVLTGEQREVKTLAEDDYYVDNAPNWARIAPPPTADEPVPAAAPAPVAPLPRKKRGR
jgi:hypothetical protein